MSLTIREKTELIAIKILREFAVKYINNNMSYQASFKDIEPKIKKRIKKLCEKYDV